MGVEKQGLPVQGALNSMKKIVMQKVRKIAQLLPAAKGGRNHLFFSQHLHFHTFPSSVLFLMLSHMVQAPNYFEVIRV